MAVQLIKDDEGKTQYVVIPWQEYSRMRLALAETDDDNAEAWRDIPCESGSDARAGLPDDVHKIMRREKVSLQAAWRIHRGLSQQEVAVRLGITQSAVSQLEAVDSRPQKRTREKLAALYGCAQEQLRLSLPKKG
ncbi:helix-turn-helix transcriptional regulator [Pseudenterobacter timonensis]|uniref:Helix-turn-helix transcriptional regulator n=1 Tax=Pseudenterobacter timonensis TaxID=1755099 RepID=A0AAE4DN62_9ENTR|nr:helix-turn-helix transcriptional regulator [Pseudenterobacter timonensis]MDR9890870.1 helix-turn-helix transcriptional regulator [Pseudenterobacter timonensis]